jgi:hypothetical protein
VTLGSRGRPRYTVSMSKKIWRKPEVKRIAAGSAESGKPPGKDGVGGGSALHS